MESGERLVVGAGVIGLAVARALARAGREVIVVETESGIGMGVSSRNSEVIHAGIYYRRCGVDQPVRDRVAGTDGEPGDRGLAGAPRLTTLRSDAYGASLVRYLDITQHDLSSEALRRGPTRLGSLLQSNA
jgi:glycine/D-amino acid oxidase-like deaminating enzyme